jgi:hypothetical protein
LRQTTVEHERFPLEIGLPVRPFAGFPFTGSGILRFSTGLIIIEIFEFIRICFFRKHFTTLTDETDKPSNRPTG